MKYTFIGAYPEVFIDLGKELQPGELIETVNPIDHPRLQLVVEQKMDKLAKAEVVE